MRRLLNDIFYSFPVQLFILHFRKYQLLLVFWFILISTIDSNFMKGYGADALFFVPEYLGKTSPLSMAIVGVAIGVFFMSWNITTFILHSKRFKFLATTSKPFLKYCINNAIAPLLFLIFYFIRLSQFDSNRELLTGGQIVLLLLGFIGGLLLLLIFSFAFFFGADRRILKTIAPVIADPKMFKKNYDPTVNPQQDGFGMKVSYFFSSGFRLKKARSVSHYSQLFLDRIFKRHHFAGMIGVLLAFIFLVIVGFFLDVKAFQVPAAASIIIFFAIMIAVIGALTYFLQSWSMVFIIVLVVVLNILYTNEIIDPRNKAYGLNYDNKTEYPNYTKQSVQRLCPPQTIQQDKENMLQILENWKKRQTSEKPVIFFVNVSGGGLRSATFTMNAFQQLDSITHGQFMKQTFLISGSSGGMLAATYYRELYRQKQNNPSINLHSNRYTDDITQDLLNPVFSSMFNRDIFSPAQQFSIAPYSYVKDRGYAFEEKLDENSENILGGQLKDYYTDERTATIPMIIYNAVVTRDGRKLIMGTQPLSFMMKPSLYAADSNYSPDAVDFSSFFAKQDPQNLRILTALRMNATFPYVLPNVWLPSTPVIDVMDAGLRDNFGQENALRFIDNFRDWLDKNTGGVVIINMRDRLKDNWQHPLVTGSVTDIFTKPMAMLQYNWYKLQDYYQSDQYDYLKDSSANIHRLTFMYEPENEDKGAELNFHLTAAEKKDVISSFNSQYNKQMVKELLSLIK
ncbi:patatin-like phospholipase family protein [Ferruginibacter albus]|uniref:patatin-like phospholipase family protein n=1 Tax=Ferruginibacter albus TaxID=2875540 RepID=UPI001CC5333F|nr:patatin-like phospholipase family protein [Ferruginibacter albus]UAY52277.1 patatin-like phospholipase family protein [Ferruginibacter albus]